MKRSVSFLVLLLVCSSLLQKAKAQVSIGITISAHTAPPPLPVYAQPIIPGDGYIWTPGYWAYDNIDGYYWVPGVWVRPPHYGLFWTPCYWGFGSGIYGFHQGYWGPHVGFYGGINYGYGYGGVGFGGGVWAGNVFRYNTAVSNVNTTIVHNTYVNKTVINNTTINNHNSFNGPGGVEARPTPQETSAMNEHHIQSTQEQLSHQQTAGKNRSQFASVNHGMPATTAMNRVNGRSFNQQGRIANGVSSGKLTAGETKNLENREANINKETHTDRADNGGQLTNGERNQVNRQQNKVSNSIHNDTHNGNNANGGGNRMQQQGRPQGARMENWQQNSNRNMNGNSRPNNDGGNKKHEQH